MDREGIDNKLGTRLTHTKVFNSQRGKSREGIHGPNATDTAD